MTEKRKEKLRQLLQETMKGLQIRYDGFLPIPIFLLKFGQYYRFHAALSKGSALSCCDSV